MIGVGRKVMRRFICQIEERKSQEKRRGAKRRGDEREGWEKERL